jgi:transposase
MEHYAGLDVALKETTICLVAGPDGRVVARGTVATEPGAIMRWLAAKCAEKGGVLVRAVHECGQLSIWLQRALQAEGLPVVCIDARSAAKVLSARPNKSDRNDAEGLAQLARTGWFTAVHIRAEASERVREMLAVRELLVGMRVRLENQARGLLKQSGRRLGPAGPGRSRAGFREALAAAAAEDAVLGMLSDTLLPVHATLVAAAEAIDAELRAIAKASPLAQRLMSVPGVGALTALAFIATADDPGRFRSAADVGAWAGLTPRRHQTGETDWSGRISKGGDARLRRLLFEAATVLICRVRPGAGGALKAWATRLVARAGFRKAAVAVARKLAVTLFALWRDGTRFEARPARPQAA